MWAGIAYESRFLKIGGILKAHEPEKFSTPYVIAIAIERAIEFIDRQKYNYQVAPQGSTTKNHL